MPKRKYALERSGPKQLELCWRRGLKDFQVAVQRATWNLDRSSLAAGATLVLPDGSSLFVKSERRSWWSIDLRNELQVERDGVPVPGSDTDPRVIGHRAAYVMVLFGLLRVGVAALWLIFEQSSAFSFIAIEGILLIAFGMVAAFGRRQPVALAAGLLVLETFLAFVRGIAPNLVGRPGGLLIQALVVVHLVRAWRRMRPKPTQPSLASVFE